MRNLRSEFGRELPIIVVSGNAGDGIAADLKRGAHTAVASNEAQFSSSPGAVPAPPMTAASPTPQFASVVSSSPVYDDDEPVAKSKKSTKKKVSSKKKRRATSTASSAKKCKGSSRKCRNRG